MGLDDPKGTNYSVPPGEALGPDTATGGDDVVSAAQGNTQTGQDDRQLRDVDEYGKWMAPPVRGPSPVDGLELGPDVRTTINRNYHGSEEIPPVGVGPRANIGNPWPDPGSGLNPKLSMSLGAADGGVKDEGYSMGMESPGSLGVPATDGMPDPGAGRDTASR